MFRIFCLILISTTIINAQGIPAANIQDTTELKLFGSEYMPLKDGLNYIYDSNVGETEMTMEKEDSTFHVSYDGAGMEYSQNLHYNNNTVYLTKTSNEVLFWGKTVTYERPVTRIPFPVKLGDSWSWEGLQKIDDYEGNVIISGKALAEETITTEAGTFNCLKVEMTVKTKRKTDRLLEWLAPGVGIVRSEAYLASGGFTGTLQSILGLDVIEFNLKAILD